MSHPIDNSNEWATEEDAALVDYAKGIVSGFVDEAVEYLPAYYNLISLPSEAADIRTKLQDISNQNLTQMIGGQMDVETAWPNYVAEYEAAGAAELETMVNEAIATCHSPHRRAKLYSALPAAAAPKGARHHVGAPAGFG